MALPPGVRILDLWLNNTFPISSAPPRTPSARVYQPVGDGPSGECPSDLRSIRRARHFPPHFPGLVSLYVTLSLNSACVFPRISLRVGPTRGGSRLVPRDVTFRGRGVYRGVGSLSRVSDT